MSGDIAEVSEGPRRRAARRPDRADTAWWPVTRGLEVSGAKKGSREREVLRNGGALNRRGMTGSARVLPTPETERPQAAVEAVGFNSVSEG